MRHLIAIVLATVVAVGIFYTPDVLAMDGNSLIQGFLQAAAKGPGILDSV